MSIEALCSAGARLLLLVKWWGTKGVKGHLARSRAPRFAPSGVQGQSLWSVGKGAKPYGAESF